MMCVFVLVFASLFASSMTQRPSFAGSRPIGRPDLASRFKDTPTETVNSRLGVVDTSPRLADKVNERGTQSTDFLNLQENHNQNLLTRGGSTQSNDLPRSQRPSFAGSRPIGRPELSPRFKDTTTQSINNRAGGDTTSDAVGGLGDQEFVNRVNSWPRENRPFDVLNSQHIRDHLYNQDNQNVQSRAGFGQNGNASRSQRPSFAGSRPIGRPDVANRFKNVEESV